MTNKRDQLRQLRIRLQILALRLEQDEDTDCISTPVAVEIMNLARDVQIFHKGSVT
jgi:hypothetical protein